jgi:hypothetical protein
VRRGLAYRAHAPDVLLAGQPSYAASARDSSSLRSQVVRRPHDAAGARRRPLRLHPIARSLRRRLRAIKRVVVDEGPPPNVNEVHDGTFRASRGFASPEPARLRREEPAMRPRRLFAGVLAAGRTGRSPAFAGDCKIVDWHAVGMRPFRRRELQISWSASPRASLSVRAMLATSSRSAGRSYCFSSRLQPSSGQSRSLTVAAREQRGKQPLPRFLRAALRR